MSLIPQHVIDEIINRTDIVQLLQTHIPLKKTGQNYSCCCPFHEEKTPSFSVSPSKQFYYCFGCGKHGNAIGFLMEYEGHGFIQAVEKLATLTGMSAVIEQFKSAATPADQTQTKQHAKLYNALNFAQTFFMEHLQNLKDFHPVIRYLKRRQISPESINTFGLGFAPPGWERLSQHLKREGVSSEEALKAGLLSTNENKDRIYDRFRDRITFAIHSNKGELIGFGGRVLGDEKPKYLNSPETPCFSKQQALYGLYQASLAKKGGIEYFIVVEGYFDVIQLHQHGLTNSVATMGTATSSHHLRALFRLTDRLVFCFDADQAGRKAAWRALEVALPLINETKHCAFLFLPEKEDPDSFVRSQGKAAFLLAMSKASSMDNFFFKHLNQTLDSTDESGIERTAKLVKTALRYIHKIQAPVIKALMQNLLCEQTGLSRTELVQLEAQLNKTSEDRGLVPATQNHAQHPGVDKHLYTQALKASGPKTPNTFNRYRGRPAAAPALGTAQHRSLINTMIMLLMQDPNMEKPKLSAQVRQLNLPNMAIFLELYDLLSSQAEVSVAYLIGLWHGTPKADLIGQLAASECLIEPDQVGLEFQDALKQLELMAIDQQIETALSQGDLDKAHLKQLLTHKLTLESHKT